MKYPELFKPFTIGRCQIKNRIVMSPMHLGGRMDSDGNFNESVIDYYVARAKGGVGLIYTCGFVPVNQLYNELCQRGNANVWNVGDSKMPTNIMNAIKDGFFIGKDI